MSTLFVFNPEHDFALAVGNGPYTPPLKVRKLRTYNSLLPGKLAGNGDFILIPSDLSRQMISSLPYYQFIAGKNVRLIYPEEILDIAGKIKFILPWGWDHSIRRFLNEKGISPSLLPSDAQLENIRQLSHRRTTIPFRATIASLLKEPLLNPARELKSVEEVESFLKEFNVAFFKAPWSSSGRGIVASDHITRKGLMEWAHGVIRRQGSIIAEPSWNKRLDFATEWTIRSGKPEFLGYSIFEASSRGKYHGNVEDSQENLLKRIQKAAPTFGEDIIEAQKMALATHIAPFYEGPLGIDMLSDNEGNINSCVEINLRLTMGHLSL